MTARFRHIMLLTPDLPGTVAFFRDGFGLEVTVESPRWAELTLDGTVLGVHASEEALAGGEAVYLSFYVDELAATVERLTGLGARLDGAVREAPFGQVAAMISPGGVRLSLTQPKPA